MNVHLRTIDVCPSRWIPTSFARSVFRDFFLASVTFLALASRVSAGLLLPHIVTTDTQTAGAFPMVAGNSAAPLWFDTNDITGVQRAVADLQADVQRVTGIRPKLSSGSVGNPPSTQPIIIGTLGKSALIDALVAAGKLQVADLTNKWESFVITTVARPFPGVDQALVIAGSDRRGTIYGIYEISEQLGVSPWYWWADVPVKTCTNASILPGRFISGEPGVKYRGIFINDEDWGMFPWAAKTFDPGLGNIGPKTYEKVFELMLRLRLNYLWPAMHACSTEFGSTPENITLADRFGIVAGSSHCEPMLCNNIHWNEKEKGRWNYQLNRDTIHDYWEENAKARGSEEAVWTLGIRGIHDAGMQTPPTDMPGKISLMTEVFRDQRELLDQHVTKKWGPIAQCFVPYKEVLPIYDAGLQVPDDVTLVWVDDNFGYIRRLSAPAERKRAGGSGVYWHLSYYGSPHSYTWINTTAPALMWEELHKAWENDARTLWVINVGDIKPMEIGIDYFARLAWNPEGFPLGAQRQFLDQFVAENFGAKSAPAMTELLMEFYRLGTVRKPELMNRDWALTLTAREAKQLEEDYNQLLKREASAIEQIPSAARDSYTELVGFPARVLGSAGLIFMADRKIQEGVEVSANEKVIASLRENLEAQVSNFNTNIAGGKWNQMMPGLVTGKDLPRWSSQVRWPWGEKPNTNNTTRASAIEQTWRDAATADRQTTAGAARWSVIEGLGSTSRAIALQPASLEAAWQVNDTNAPMLQYDFTARSESGNALIDFLPTFRIYPGMKLRVAVSLDNAAPKVIEVPGSSGAENENGTVRSFAVQNNYVRASVPLPELTKGKHTLTIRAIDPGAVIDQLSLP